ncbi:MAG: hypothetical protein KDD40_00530 [Bdellovibrionales bacterium]|nr:hypothetical protein [Bdellovibrionales bacterium]
MKLTFFILLFTEITNAQSTLVNNDIEKRVISLEWEAVEDAVGYQVEIRKVNNNGSKDTALTKKTKSSQWNPEIPIGKYEMRIRSYDQRGVPGEWSENIQFFVKPKAVDLISPKNLAVFSTSANDEEIEILFQWSKNLGSQSYVLKVESEDGQFKYNEILNESEFKINVPVGKTYTWQVIAKVDDELLGEESETPFKFTTQYKSEDKELLTVEKSKPNSDKQNVLKDEEKIYKSNFYYLASYLITQMNYKGVDKSNGISNQLDALGGTGRLGMGYIEPNHRFGLLGIVDMSGFVIGSENFTFSSAEIHGVYRKFTAFSEFQVSMGLFVKELVALNGTASGTFSGVGKVKNMGPHVGFSYWRALNNKLGVQANGRFYSAMSGSGPNGETLSPEVSYELGVLGTYKLSDNFRGYAGFKHRKDRSSYNAIAADKDPNSFASPGDISFVEISGNYLNFILEYRY